MMKPWQLALLVAAALSLALGAGCGDAGRGTRVLAATDERLRTIESGSLTLSVTGAATGSGGAKGEAEGDPAPPVGFRLEGPFSFDTDEPLPVARLVYTRLLGGQEQEATFISTGTSAFVESAGRTYTLPEELVRNLQVDPDAGDRSAGLDQLRLETWVKEPAVAREGGADVITGRLDVARAFGDLAALARQLGVPDTGDLQRLGDQDRRRIEQLVKSSSIRIVTSRDDHLLRELQLRVDLRPGRDAGTRRALGRLGGSRLDLHLTLDELNQPVEVEAPAGARPLPEVPPGG